MLLQRGLFRTSQSVILGAGFEIIPIIPLTPSLPPEGRGGIGTKFNERRTYYGNTNPLGNIVNDGKGEGKEGEKTDSDGLL
jgi:hypothetical protein